MSLKTKNPSSYQDVYVVHDKTPSPPPKPPRGIMRKGAPLKPQRSAIKIEPITQEEKENSQPQQSSQFKARDTMDQMQSYFKRSIAVIRRTEEFTGTEAADILTAYIESHRNDFPRDNVGRANAVKLLEIWRQQKIIHSVDNQKKFADSERSFYRLGGESEQCLYIATTPVPSGVYDDSVSSVSRSSSTRRSNSFKRLFSPLVRRNRSNSRGRDKDSTKDGTSTLLKSTWSLFSSSTEKQEKKAKRAEQQLIKEEEAEVYELALFHLLGLVEVEFLEDVALPVQDSKKNASFLTSIMEKMGLGHGERLDPQQEEDMDLLIETHPLIRDASQWFQMARCCAPTLYLQKSPEKSSKMQLFLWCKAALTAVSSQLEKVTQNGASPLFPTEFAPLLTKIAQQLINDFNSGDKLSTAVMYIFLMVPHPLRKTIDQIIHWLQLTLRTDAVEDLRSPYYLGRTEPRHKENVKVIVEELRPFIFPRGCMNNAQQDIFIETLIELRQKGRLGQRPAQLENSLRAKHNSTENDLTPVRFTVARESLRAKAEKNKEGLSETDAALVQMMESVIDNKKISLTDKKKQLTNFAKCYPGLYEGFFKNML